MTVTIPEELSFFVSIHIPKTAGTTLGTILNRTLNFKVLMDYPGYAGTDYKTPDPLIHNNRDFIRAYYKGIHGHFNVKRHQDSFPDAKFITTLRHPVHRLISQFHHEINDETNSTWHDALKSGEATIVDMAKDPDLQRAMAFHLEGRDIRDYDLIMISERFDESLKLLQYTAGNLNLTQHFGIPPQYPYENSGSNRQIKVEISDQIKAELYRLMPEDVALYREAVEIFTKKTERLGQASA